MRWHKQRETLFDLFKLSLETHKKDSLIWLYNKEIRETTATHSPALLFEAAQMPNYPPVFLYFTVKVSGRM